jgi:hypothetical protein
VFVNLLKGSDLPYLFVGAVCGQTHHRRMLPHGPIRGATRMRIVYVILPRILVHMIPTRVQDSWNQVYHKE